MNAQKTADARRKAALYLTHAESAARDALVCTSSLRQSMGITADDIAAERAICDALSELARAIALIRST